MQINLKLKRYFISVWPIHILATLFPVNSSHRVIGKILKHKFISPVRNLAILKNMYLIFSNQKAFSLFFKEFLIPFNGFILKICSVTDVYGRSHVLIAQTQIELKNRKKQNKTTFIG